MFLAFSEWDTDGHGLHRYIIFFLLWQEKNKHFKNLCKFESYIQRISFDDLVKSPI